MSNTFIRPTDRIQSGATTPGKSGPGSDCNKGIHRITGASPSDCLVSYPWHTLGESYPCWEIQSEYSAASADRVNFQTDFIFAVIFLKSDVDIIIQIFIICFNYIIDKILWMATKSLHWLFQLIYLFG